MDGLLATSPTDGLRENRFVVGDGLGAPARVARMAADTDPATRNSDWGILISAERCNARN